MILQKRQSLTGISVFLPLLEDSVRAPLFAYDDGGARDPLKVPAQFDEPQSGRVGDQRLHPLVLADTKLEHEKSTRSKRSSGVADQPLNQLKSIPPTEQSNPRLVVAHL